MIHTKILIALLLCITTISLIIGCPSADTDSAGGDGGITQDEYYFYTDKSGKGQSSNGDFTLWGEYKVSNPESDAKTLKSSTENGGADGTATYNKLVSNESSGENWAGGGWTQPDDNKPTTVDLSKYDTLVFWAKSATDTQIKFSLEDAGDKESPQIVTIINNAWKKYEISFEDLKVTDASKVTVLSYFLVDRDPATEGLQAAVDLDEIYVYKKPDSTVPTLATTGHTAEDGANFVKIKFSENITLANGSKTATSAPAGITVASGATNSLATNAVTAAVITGSELTLTLTTALVAAEKVKVTFDADTIIDTSGNKLAATDTGEITISTPKTATGLTTPDGFEIWVPTGATTHTTINQNGTITYSDSSTSTATNFTGLFVSAVDPSTLLTANTNNISLVAGSNAGTADLTFSVVGTTIASTTTVKARVITADTDSTKYWFWGPTLDLNGMFYPAYEETMTTVVSDDSGTQILMLTDTNKKGWSAGGFQMPAAFVDISNYTNLVITAKDPTTANKTAGLNILLKFEADGKDGINTPITNYNSAGQATAQALTSNFQTYKIPVSVLASDKNKTQLSFFNLEFAYETTNVKEYEVAISELYFE